MFKKRIFWLLALSLLGLISGFFLVNSYEIGLCIKYSPNCHQAFLDIGRGLIYSMPALASVFLLLLFVPQAVSAWWKFAIWYIPLASLQIFFSHPEPGAMFDFTPSVQEAGVWLSGIYIAVSLIIIAISYFSSKRTIVSK